MKPLWPVDQPFLDQADDDDLGDQAALVQHFGDLAADLGAAGAGLVQHVAVESWHACRGRPAGAGLRALARARAQKDHVRHVVSAGAGWSFGFFAEPRLFDQRLVPVGDAR